MKYAIILCGLPGSGKSTLASYIEQKYKDFNIISFDELSCITYDDFIEEILLKNNTNLVLDAVFQKNLYRTKIIKTLKQFNYCSILIYCNLSAENCFSRIQNREKIFSLSLLKAMEQRFEPPSYDEGWDEIYYCYEEESEFL